MGLNKGLVDDLTSYWYTDNYALVLGNSEYASVFKMGYDIVNRETRSVEMSVEQEPPAIMAMLYLQDNYDNVMADPEAVYKRRKMEAEGRVSDSPLMTQ